MVEGCLYKTIYWITVIALETLGPICRAASDLITELSRRTSERSGESHEGDFLFQRLSIAVQRGNDAALHCTFGEFAI